jgi:hypothetical protein
MTLESCRGIETQVLHIYHSAGFSEQAMAEPYLELWLRVVWLLYGCCAFDRSPAEPYELFSYGGCLFRGGESWHHHPQCLTPDGSCRAFNIAEGLPTETLPATEETGTGWGSTLVGCSRASSGLLDFSPVLPPITPIHSQHLEILHFLFRLDTMECFFVSEDAPVLG